MQLAKSLQNIKPSYIREILSVANSQDIISLAGGLPDQASFPLSLMQDSLSNLTNYLHYFNTEVQQDMRHCLSTLSNAYQLPSSHEGDRLYWLTTRLRPYCESIYKP